jgi:hypothetical protein
VQQSLLYVLLSRREQLQILQLKTAVQHAPPWHPVCQSEGLKAFLAANKPLGARLALLVRQQL